MLHDDSSPAPGAVRLLCTGDLHLGRVPSRLPEVPHDLTIEAVWQRTVEYAVGHRVDAVVLTGDLADTSDDYFEPYGVLRRGLERLAAAGIPAFAVAGNHDFRLAPRLAEGLGAQIRLLGQGGRWEAADLLRDGQPVARLVGWSFPGRHVDESPLGSFPPLETDLPVVAVVHGELIDGAGSSRYAPLSRRDMERHPVAAWLLGHIHAPRCEEVGQGILLYPGSLQPLDPGEEGVHGPWLVEVPPRGRAVAEPAPLASLAYARLDVDLSGATDLDEANVCVTTTVQDDLRRRHDAADDLLRVVYRLRLTGRTALHARAAELAGKLAGVDVHACGRTGSIIDRVETDTRPTFDLATLAGRRNPVGVLAGLLLELEADARDNRPVRPEHRALMGRAEASVRRVEQASGYTPLRNDEGYNAFPDVAAQRRLLIEQAWKLLDALLAQKPDEVPVPEGAEVLVTA